MLKVLGQEFDLEILDLDVCEDVFGKMDETDKAVAAVPPSDGSIPGIIVQQTAMYAAWAGGLDAILGEGAVQKLLGGKRHVGKARQAWDDLVDGFCEQYIAFQEDSARRQKARSERVAKYGADRIAKR